jgi:integrase
MSFITDAQELKTGLIIFRRADVKHQNWYCRIKIPAEDRYKTVSLKTPDINTAKDLAFDQDADVRFRIKHDVPVFNRPFSQVAEEFAALQKERADTGQISQKRYENIVSWIKSQLNRYVGNIQITQIGEDKWTRYPIWRRTDTKGLNGHVSDATIRTEMSVFRSIMVFAASKKYISERQIFKGKIPKSKASREEFTPDEYRKLHTFARSWVKQARTEINSWYRSVVYLFILIMCNTGMRPVEAKNLRWRDIEIRDDDQGRKLVIITVRGKDKFRQLVAAGNVAEYFERLRAIAKKTEPNDFVFTTVKGEAASTLYKSLIALLLTEAKLAKSANGTHRSTYCFRHTYATFRLSEGVDVYFLAKQMGTSVQMIENHYGHITPVKNAERILQGLPGWESIAVAPQVIAEAGRVHNGPAKPRGAKRKARKADS